MSLPDIKALKKLADTCRKAGISHFKSADFEFTLTDSLPPKKKATKKDSLPTADADDGIISSPDTLSAEQMLMWSTMDLSNDPNQKTIG